MYVDEALRISVEAPNLFRVLWSHLHLLIEWPKLALNPYSSRLSAFKASSSTPHPNSWSETPSFSDSLSAISDFLRFRDVAGRTGDIAVLVSDWSKVIS